MKEFAKKILVIGLIISGIGLGLQWFSPMKIQTGVFQSHADLPISQEFMLNMPYARRNVTKFQMYFRVSVISTSAANVSIYLLSNAAYEQYSSGIPLDQIDLLHNMTISKSSYNNYSYSEFYIDLFSGIPYHAIILNHSISDFSIIYFCSLTSDNYNIGLYVLTFGVFMICAGFFLELKGWKRWLVVGIGANLFVFFLRATLLPRDFSMVEIGTNLLHPELYADFQYYTIQWAQNFARGLSPYTPEMEGYLYSPLYYWIIGIFGLIALPPWIIAVPLVFANLFTGYLVSQIVEKISGREKTIIAAICIYYFNPFVLCYGSMMWLNPSLFVCCVMGGIYALLHKQTAWAGIALGLATMFKQFAIIFLPLFLLAQLRLTNSTTLIDVKWTKWKQFQVRFWEKLKSPLKLGLYFLIPIVGISIPYLILDAPAYLYRWIWGNMNLSIGYLTTFYSYSNYPVTFNTALLALNGPWDIVFGIAFLLRYYVLLGGSIMVILVGFLLCTHPHSSKDSIPPTKIIWNMIFWGFLIVCALQLFYPRGSYKYYLLLLAPFMALLVLRRMNTVVFENIIPKHHLIPLWVSIIILSWVIFLIHRYLYFPILLVWGIYLVIIRRKGY